MTASRFVDLSHAIESGMAVHPGLPVPRIEPHISHDASRPWYGGEAEFEITRLFMVGNTGTSLDSPFHRFRDAPDVAALRIEAVAGLPGLVAPVALDVDGRSVSLDLPPDIEGAAVLVRTGWDRRWGTAAYWEPGPFLAGPSLDALEAAGVALVGVDFANVDDPAVLARPAHTRLLASGILVVEHLTGLEALPTSGFRFFAVPARARGAASMPVRAFAEVSEATY